MRKLFRDTAYTGVSHFLISVMQICLQVYVVRTTVPANFGAYSAALAIESIIESLCIARSGELALQFIGKHWVGGELYLARAYASRMMRVDMVLNWSLYAVLVVLSFILKDILKIDPYYLSGLALMIPAQIGYGIYKSVFISAHRLKEQAMFESSFMICQLCLGVLGVYLRGIPGLVGALVLSALIKTIVAREITKRWWPEEVQLAHVPLEQDSGIVMESWWHFGLHSITRNAFASGASQVDILILNAMKGAEQVAIYKVAKTLSSLPVRAAGPMWSALRPRILKAWHYKDREHMKRLVVFPSLLMLGALIVVAPLIWFFADDLILRLYGKTYIPAALPFMILLAGSWIFSAMTAWYVFWVIISEATMAGSFVYALLFSLTIGAGISWGGHSAIAMATVVSGSMIIVSVACWLIFFRALNRLGRSVSSCDGVGGLGEG